MSLFMLIVAFTFTGLIQISNQALSKMGLSEYADIYMLGLWVGGLALGLIFKAASQYRAEAKDVTIGTIMGILSAAALFTLLVALRDVSAVVAFPVRSCGNIALTAGISYVAWREQITALQWTGIACAVAAIYLLV